MTSRIYAEPIGGLPRCQLAESPRWHDGRWWWVDVNAGLAYAARVDGGAWHAELRVATGRRLSLVYPAGADRVLVANSDRIELWSSRDEPRFLGVAASLRLAAGCVLNDGTADPWGRLWIGMVDVLHGGARGRLLRVGGGDDDRPFTQPFRMSNGLAFDAGGRRLFHADSADRVVYEHAVSAAGIDHTRRYLICGDGIPDGLACDAAGGVWVAMYGTGEVRRHDASGSVDAVVVVPTAQVTSVAIGGADGRDMLVTTAREGYDEVRSAAEPLAGRIFHARAPYPAAPVYAASLSASE